MHKKAETTIAGDLQRVSEFSIISARRRTEHIARCALSHVYTRAACWQHVAVNMLLVAVNKIRSSLGPNEQLVAGQLLTATCCSSWQHVAWPHVALV